MCPIHDSDAAQERWSRDEWRTIELWEKLEQRLRKYKRYWVGATAVIFIILSAIPVVMDRFPRWRALRMARALAEEISGLKIMASTTRRAHKLTFVDSENLIYRIESSASCTDPPSEFKMVRAAALTSQNTKTPIVLINQVTAERLHIPGVITSVCYDPANGLQELPNSEDLKGFALTPVKDLTEERQDRFAIVLLKGPSAEISFN